MRLLPSIQDEQAAVHAVLTDWLNNGIEAHEIGIFVRTNDLVERARVAVSGLPGEELMTTVPMSLAKGLARLNIDPASPPIALRRYFIGRDLVQRPEEKWVIDFNSLTERESDEISPQLYQHILQTVKPERDQNRRATRRQNWWNFGENAPTLRRAMVGLDRIIATCRTSKHRIFSFVRTDIIVDAKIIGIAVDDAFYLGLLSSHAHVIWALRTGGFLEDRPNYNHSDYFGKFPFPTSVPKPLMGRIRAEAEALDAFASGCWQSMTTLR